MTKAVFLSDNLSICTYITERKETSIDNYSYNTRINGLVSCSLEDHSFLSLYLQDITRNRNTINILLIYYNIYYIRIIIYIIFILLIYINISFLLIET